MGVVDVEGLGEVADCEEGGESCGGGEEGEGEEEEGGGGEHFGGGEGRVLGGCEVGLFRWQVDV